MRPPLSVVLLLFAVPALAADPPKFDQLPEPPPPVKDYQAPRPPQAEADDEAIPEPEVVITPRGEDRHEEYRIGGRLYMIKVIPKHGAPYYLIDNEGRGEFVRSDFLPSVSPPMWVIKRF
jgi:hypothetical protein